MFGVARALQVATRTWRPWQRYALALGLVVAGVGLMWYGVGRGVVLVLAGGLVAIAAARRRRARGLPDDSTGAGGS